MPRLSPLRFSEVKIRASHRLIHYSTEVRSMGYAHPYIILKQFSTSLVLLSPIHILSLLRNSSTISQSCRSTAGRYNSARPRRQFLSKMEVTNQIRTNRSTAKLAWNTSEETVLEGPVSVREGSDDNGLRPPAPNKDRQVELTLAQPSKTEWKSWSERKEGL